MAILPQRVFAALTAISWRLLSVNASARASPPKLPRFTAALWTRSADGFFLPLLLARTAASEFFIKFFGTKIEVYAYRNNYPTFVIMNRNNKDFQTPTEIIEYMSLMIDFQPESILEPTPGAGRMVRYLREGGRKVIAPRDFFSLKKGRRFDLVVMNPPFTPMALGYKILFDCMERTDRIIALMPWLTIINSEKRLAKIEDYGLKSITHLPRKIFPGSRVQTCILNMSEGYSGKTEFEVYTS